MSADTRNAAIHEKLNAINARLSENLNIIRGDIQTLHGRLEKHRDQHDSLNLKIIGSLITSVVAMGVAALRRMH